MPLSTAGGRFLTPFKIAGKVVITKFSKENKDLGVKGGKCGKLKTKKKFNQFAQKIQHLEGKQTEDHTHGADNEERRAV